MRKIASILVCFVLLTPMVSAQSLSKKDAKSLLLNLADYYSGESYELAYSKKIYQTSSESEPMNSVSGRFILGKNHQYRVEETGTLIIQNKEINLVIDSNTNEMFVNSVDLEFMPIDIGGFLNDSIYELYTFDVLKGENSHQLTIKSRLDPSSYIRYEFTPSTYQISSFKYVFPKANYFSESLNDETLESPVMIVEYEPKKQLKLKDDFFSVSGWFSSLKSPLQLSETENRFTLYDLRPQSH